jgi:hypothetical protein
MCSTVLFHSTFLPAAAHDLQHGVCLLPGTAQDVLDLLQACQKRWLQLLPALSAPEVAAQAPEVAEQHEAASAALKDLLGGAATAASPQEALQALVLPAEQRLAQLQACQASLEKVGRLRAHLLELHAGPSCPGI